MLICINFLRKILKTWAGICNISIWGTDVLLQPSIWICRRQIVKSGISSNAQAEVVKFWWFTKTRVFLTRNHQVFINLKVIIHQNYQLILYFALRMLLKYYNLQNFKKSVLNDMLKIPRCATRLRTWFNLFTIVWY